MEVAATTVEHMKHVLANLSEQNRAEHELVGITREGALKLFVDHMVRGEANTGLIDGEPVVVFGVLFSDPNNFTWFIATEAYWKLGPAAIRFGRRFLKERAHYQPLHTITCSPHPNVDRWFKLLGFEKYGEDGAFRYFKYGKDVPISMGAKASVARPEVAAPDTSETGDLPCA